MNSILKIIIALKSGFETKNLAKYLSERLMGAEKGGNFTKDNLYKCLRMLRALLLIRLYNHGINLKYLSKIYQKFNSKIKRNKISNEEFYFTFEVAKRQNDNDKIIIPQFEIPDIIYCFIQYKENDIYEMGPIFKNKNRTDLFKDFIKKLEEQEHMNMIKYIDF